MKQYKQYLISSEPFNVELLSGVLWDLDISGITENDNFIFLYTDDTKEVTTDDIKNKLEFMQKNNLLESYTLEESDVENKNWNEEWEKTIEVIEVTDKIVIKPSFREYEEKPNQIIITIDPKMSFGTGKHQTTKLVLTLLDEYINDNDKVLDVGSGTGVLAIAASLLGARHVVGVDNDEWCQLNGNENIELNKVNDKTEIVLGEIKDVKEKEFDLILANINKHILLNIADELKDKLKPEGILILSGLLIQDEDDIQKHYSSAGFKVTRTEKLDEWISIVMKSEN